MTRIGIRELRQHASRYVEKVKAGEVIEVTERGKLVALLVAPKPGVSSRDRLVASGQLAPSRGVFRLPERRELPHDVRSSATILDEIREDRIT